MASLAERCSEEREILDVERKQAVGQAKAEIEATGMLSFLVVNDMPLPHPSLFSRFLHRMDLVRSMNAAGRFFVVSLLVLFSMP